MKQLLLDAFLPVISAFLSIFVPALMALAYSRFQKWTGLEIEARHREALQSALANAARLIAGGASKTLAIDYVLASVPDALLAFQKMERHQVQELLDPHIAGQKVAAKAAVAVFPDFRQPPAGGA